MPSEFDYTCSGTLNDSYQGFHHTFLRHWDQWLRHIPQLRTSMSQLDDEIRTLLSRINKSDDPESRAEATKLLEAQLETPRLYGKYTNVKILNINS